MVATACGSSSGPSSSTKASSSTTTAVPSSYARYPKGLRGVRYCEVLLLRKEGGAYVAHVWNTLGMSACPAAEWNAIDFGALAKERAAVVALKNGPRFWMLDEIISNLRKGAPTTRFGTIAMFEAATIRFGRKIPDQSPYLSRRIVRDTIFRFKAGRRVYQLTDPEGRPYVMQSYAQINDPTLTEARLGTLGTVLHLPPGWNFSTRVLSADLDVHSTKGMATVVQDELQNTYQRIDAQGAG